jgi:membrane protein YdbS with pleckstrin-like domain
VSDEIPPDLGSPGKGVGVAVSFTLTVLLVAVSFTLTVLLVVMLFAIMLPPTLKNVLGTLAAAALFGIGVVQAAWIVPLWRRYRAIGETETAKGLLIAAGIIFLLNAGCWGIVATTWR